MERLNIFCNEIAPNIFEISKKVKFFLVDPLSYVKTAILRGLKLEDVINDATASM